MKTNPKRFFLTKQDNKTSGLNNPRSINFVWLHKVNWLVLMRLTSYIHLRRIRSTSHSYNTHCWQVGFVGKGEKLPASCGKLEDHISWWAQRSNSHTRCIWGLIWRSVIVSVPIFFLSWQVLWYRPSVYITFCIQCHLCIICIRALHSIFPPYIHDHTQTYIYADTE